MRFCLLVVLLVLCSCKCEVTIDSKDFFYVPPKPPAPEAPKPKPTHEDRECKLNARGLGLVKEHGWTILSQDYIGHDLFHVIMRRPLTAEQPLPADPMIFKKP